MTKRSDSDPRDAGAPVAEQSEAHDPALSDRLQRLNAALDKARPRDQSQPGGKRDDKGTASGMALAFRLGSEFVAGVLVGAALGWGIDQMFGWAPWGILAFTLIGFGAGIVNMMRAAGELGRKKS